MLVDSTSFLGVFHKIGKKKTSQDARETEACEGITRQIYEQRNIFQNIIKIFCSIAYQALGLNIVQGSNLS